MRQARERRGDIDLLGTEKRVREDEIYQALRLEARVREANMRASFWVSRRVREAK